MEAFQKDVKQENDGVCHVRLDYSSMAPIRLGTCGPFGVTLEADFATPGTRPGSAECSVRQDLVVRFKSASVQTLDTGITAAANMYRFLTFATVTKTRIISLTATTAGDFPVEVLFNGLELEDDTPCYPNDCVFSLTELGSAPATFLSGCFERDSSTYPVNELLATCTEWGNQYCWSRSVLGIQALEVYHRQTAAGDGELPQDVFLRAKRQVLKAIVDRVAVPFFAGRLKHAYEPSLQTRLQHLVDRAAPALDTQPTQHERYVALAVDTRNYYTHWDPTSARGHGVGWDLQEVADWAELLLRALLMLDMGLAADRVAHLLRTSNKTRRNILDLFPPAAANNGQTEDGA